MLRASSRDEGTPHAMLDAGLDLSRKRLDFHLLDGEGATVERGATREEGDRFWCEAYRGFPSSMTEALARGSELVEPQHEFLDLG